MGCFGYICKGCGTSIRGDYFNGGEKTIMIHVRHGEELGRVEGHYDEYGRVIEQEGFIDDYNSIQYLKENKRNVMEGMENLIISYIRGV